MIRSQKLAKTKVRKSLGYLQPGILAKEMKLVQRKARKCSVSDLILSFWKTMLQGAFSYDNLASEVSVQSMTKTISGQAVWKRLTAKRFNPFLKKLLQKSLKKRCDSFVESDLFKAFPNVYIQDATHYKLARHLAEYFPGSYSKKGHTATAKVQAVFNLTKGVFADFTLCSFRDNDQKDAPRFIKKMKKGELIIRDLGYAVLTVFEKIYHKKAYFLSRFKYNLTI
ncbi:MAG TPA: hypothetical protein DCS93_14530, partial [Microscillaceae bacterium]|nr:hypothetical protein [Microscillaceae bacterium]